MSLELRRSACVTTRETLQGGVLVEKCAGLSISSRSERSLESEIDFRSAKILIVEDKPAIFQQIQEG